MSQKRVVLLVGLALALTPLSALANSIDLGFVGGAMVQNGFALTTTSVGGGTSSTLTAVAGSTDVNAPNLGTVDITTGLAPDDLTIASGGLLAPGGSITVNSDNYSGWGGAANDLVFSGQFLGSQVWDSVGGGFYTLQGQVSGTLSPALQSLEDITSPASGALVTLNLYVPAGGNSYEILSGDLNLTGAPDLVAEPATLSLFGLGLMGLVVGMRRKLLRG